MFRAIVRIILDTLGQNVLRLLKGLLNLRLVEDQIGGFLAMLVPHPRVAASLAHHLDHLGTQLLVLLVGVSYGDVEWCVFVRAGQRVAFEVLDVKEGVHHVVCRGLLVGEDGYAGVDVQLP